MQAEKKRNVNNLQTKKIALQAMKTCWFLMKANIPGKLALYPF